MADDIDERNEQEEGDQEEQDSSPFGSAAGILGLTKSKSGDSARVAELEAEVEKYKNIADEHKDKTLRAFAEVENMRTKVLRDIEKSRKFAVEGILKELLPTVDTLEHAMDAARSESQAATLEGLELTHKMLMETLKKFGVEVVSPEGDKFDPELHEALSTQPTDEHEPNTVLTVVQKGYQLNGRVVRPARVIVAKAAD